MSADANLSALADLCGILPQYIDMQSELRVTSPDTCRSLLAAMGVAAENDADVRGSLAALNAEFADRLFPEEVIIESGTDQILAFGTGAAWTLSKDESTDEIANGVAIGGIALPPLSSGVYELSVKVGRSHEIVRVLAAPRRLASVEMLTGARRLWGINLGLYGLRSSRNCGLGDYVDLARVATLAAEKGAAFVGVNPLHSMGFADAAFSPYSPSHRGFLNTNHIAVDAIPGLQDTRSLQDVLSREAIQIAACRASKDVAYALHKETLHRILGTLFGVFQQEAPAAVKAQYQDFVQSAGPDLVRFATYEALSEQHGSDWRNWPPSGQPTPDPDRIDFHQWLQWVADTQLHTLQIGAKAAGLSLGLYLDLAVGPRRSGAESWCEQSSIATNVSIGAPPDHLSPEGQNWDLAAFAPRKLQRENYRPLRRILAQIMRHAGVVRIDHVLGLMRSFLIPDSGAPGGYVSQPMQSLIAIIKIEAEHNNCAVIGEDLGLVPENFREEMRSHGFYGYSVLQYEKTQDGAFRHPDEGNAQVLSCFATHDTPTVKGYETGCDIKWWQRLEWITPDQARAAQTERAKDLGALKNMSGPECDFQTSVTAILAGSPASMVSIQLDDILGLTEAQNLPGTIDQHPNWRRKYPVLVEDLQAFDPLACLSMTMARLRNTQQEENCHDNPVC